ncbi:hypothetical protein V7S43_009994 [Phytophthora oleae]|uniref:Uncharacterized protein n=1 Tax=Phytophthora oleae TaxID=2107226 RepID=A0ABD3FET6_9STRA
MNAPTTMFSSTSVAGTSAAVLISTAASNMATGKISVPEYFALQKEKQQAKLGSAVIDPKEIFGNEIPLDYDDEELAIEEGGFEDKAPVPVSSSEDTHDLPLGSRRLREEAPDASSSKRPRSDEEASPMSRALVSPRTDPPPVRDPWMPTDAEIQSRLGESCPPNEILLYYDNSIVDDDVADAIVFESPTPSSLSPRLKDRSIISGSSMSFDTSARRRLRARAKCQSGRHSVNRGTALL